MQSFLAYWGKAQPETLSSFPYHPLAYHSLDVAAVVEAYLRANETVAGRLSEALGQDCATAQRLAAFLAAAHDLGKFSLVFQAKQEALYAQLHPGVAMPTGAEHHSQSGLPALLKWTLGTHEAAFESAGDFFCPDGAELKWEPLLNAACGHHGFPVSNLSAGEFRGRSLVAAQAYLTEVWALFGKPLLPSLSLSDESVALASHLLAGVIAVCDWVGSSQQFFPYVAPEHSLQDYWERARQQAAHAIQELHLVERKGQQQSGLAHLFPQYLQTATPLQRYADTVALSTTEGPELFILEDETGSGKTEAALTLASRLVSAGKATGVMVSLPTQTTADAFCRRLLPLANKFLEGSSTFTLAHGNSQLSLSRMYAKGGTATSGGAKEGIEVELKHWAAESNKTAFLSDLGVCTIDQVVLSVLPTKHFAMRQLGLGRKVLVVDEAHSCEPYLLKLLELALESHARRGGSAIVLSATLPCKTRQGLLNAFARGAAYKARKAQVLAYPLATRFNSEQLTETAIEAKGLPKTVLLSRIAEALVVVKVGELLEKGKSVLLLRNTVASAQASFDMFSVRHPGQVFLAHARFVTKHRAENDIHLLNNFGKSSGPGTRKGQLVISTQVAEQSLDVDFDELITDLAPIDSLLQRMGRRRRHVRDAQGNCQSAPGAVDTRDEGAVATPVWVVCPPTSGNDEFLAQLPAYTGFVYDMPGVLLRTAELVEKGSLTIPSDVRAAVEYAYADSYQVPDAMAKAQERADAKQIDARMAAKCKGLPSGVAYCADLLNSFIPGDAVTRLGEPSIALVLSDEQGNPLFGTQELSIVRLRQSLLNVSCDDKGRAVLRLTQVGSTEWEGSASDHKGRLRVVSYSRASGLRVNPAE